MATVPTSTTHSPSLSSSMPVSPEPVPRSTVAVATLVRSQTIESLNSTVEKQLTLATSTPSWSKVVRFPDRNIAQTKWGHLKGVQGVLKSLEATLTNGNVSDTNFGNSVKVNE
ncbi:hypothetical protein VNO80_23088 [Phaseolus coccineus]|uniref:Uncharacterized protein n=1 Tax=Phaseolus coccineus TaxID=3886 RepID=A0AAN9QSB7_PHACN